MDVIEAGLRIGAGIPRPSGFAVVEGGDLDIVYQGVSAAYQGTVADTWDYQPADQLPHSFADAAMDVAIDGDIAWVAGPRRKGGADEVSWSCCSARKPGCAAATARPPSSAARPRSLPHSPCPAASYPLHVEENDTSPSGVSDAVGAAAGSAQSEFGRSHADSGRLAIYLTGVYHNLPLGLTATRPLPGIFWNVATSPVKGWSSTTSSEARPA